VFNSQAITVSDFFKFREDKYTFLFSSANTKSEFFESIFNSFKKSFKPFVLGLSKEKSSTTLIEFDLAGTTTVSVTQPGDANHLPLTKTFTVVVSKDLTHTISISDERVDCNDSPIFLNPTSNSIGAFTFSRCFMDSFHMAKILLKKHMMKLSKKNINFIHTCS